MPRLERHCLVLPHWSSVQHAYYQEPGTGDAYARCPLALPLPAAWSTIQQQRLPECACSFDFVSHATTPSRLTRFRSLLHAQAQSRISIYMEQPVDGRKIKSRACKICRNTGLTFPPGCARDIAPCGDALPHLFGDAQAYHRPTGQRVQNLCTTSTPPTQTPLRKHGVARLGSRLHLLL